MTPEETLKRAVHEYAFDIALRYVRYVRERLDEMPSDPEGWHDVLTAVRDYAASDEAIFGKAEKRRYGILLAKEAVCDAFRQWNSQPVEGIHKRGLWSDVGVAVEVLHRLETP